jgi:hypothetical protein
VTGKDAYKIAFKNEAPAQKEGASMSTTTSYERLRIAAAAAREDLTLAGAEKWDIAVSQCRTEKGFAIFAALTAVVAGKRSPRLLPIRGTTVTSSPLLAAGEFRPYPWTCEAEHVARRPCWLEHCDYGRRQPHPPRGLSSCRV